MNQPPSVMEMFAFMIVYFTRFMTALLIVFCVIFGLVAIYGLFWGTAALIAYGIVKAILTFAEWIV